MPPAARFRSVADSAARRTILFDEIDTIFGPKAKEHEELRGLVNAEHRRSGVAYRYVGEGTVAEIPAYAAVALAGLGKFPDIIAEQLTTHRPDMPPGVTDRPADVWDPSSPSLTPLVASGPSEHATPAPGLVRDNADCGISLSIRLLADLRDISGDSRAMTTENVLT